MKKTGDSCAFIKQLLPVLFVLFVVTFTGVKFINNDTKEKHLGIVAYYRNSLSIPTKFVDESGNVISSSTGFTNNTSDDSSTSNLEMSKNAKQAIDGIFNGTYILNIMKNSNLADDQKTVIYGIFGEENPNTVVNASEQVNEEASEEENIIIDSSVSSDEEIIEVEQVVANKTEEEKVTLAPGQESVWLYEESQVPDNYITYYDMSATAYCLCKKCTGKTPGSSGYGRTSSGLVIKPGTSMKVCAVNKKQIPLGTHIYVQGLNGAKDYGYAIAADTGGAITQNRIDLYFDNHSTCLKWGRRSVRVYILPDEE